MQQTFFENTNRQWLIFILALAFAVLFNRWLSGMIRRLIFKIFRRRMKGEYAETYKEYVSPPLRTLLVLLIVDAAFQVLKFPNAWNFKIFETDLQTIFSRLFYAVILFTFFRLLLRLSDFITFILKEHAKHIDSKVDDQLVIFLRDVVKALLFITFVLLLLGAIFNFNITSLIAGVGIGGLAIAFAAQESLKDLFGSITVFLDKPFIVGDLVQIGDVQGTIERVGIRSTRIRTNDKTFVTLPNKKILDSNVNNFTRRTYRRVNQQIGVAYETSPATLQAAISEIEKFIEDDPIYKDDEHYVILDNFGESSLNIVVEYYIPQMPGPEFLKHKQRMNFKLLEILARHEVRIAYPVRAVRMIKSETD